MNEESKRLAEEFLTRETQFHLGFLPTEQSHPLSRTLESDYRESPEKGVRCLQKVDHCVLDMAKKIFASRQFADLAAAMYDTIAQSGKVVFSGCGATGRLSILLESMWRKACQDLAPEYPHLRPLADHVFSIMTGGDYALVRSVEFFEDYKSFGVRQVQEMGMTGEDMLVAITEGGETSSVLGTCAEALHRGARVFLLFNNPADLLAEHLERSREIIRDPRVTVLDLSCGPMALAGSTRMQATTSEQLVAGGALESALCRFAGLRAPDYAADFEALLKALETEKSVSVLAAYSRFECDTYAQKGRITYFSDFFLLDIFTDTTERSPTFMLPPFRKKDDTVSPVSWAFVKNPLCPTKEVWQREMCRPLRCLEWQDADYTAMGAKEDIRKHPPKITAQEVLKFEIGNEPPEGRTGRPADASVKIFFGDENSNSALISAADSLSEKFAVRKTLSLASDKGDYALPDIPRAGKNALLRLMDHMAVKLVLNTISTGTMVLGGRVSGNWMSWVALSNKKLIDRGIRLIAELGKMEYKDACRLLFETVAEVEAEADPSREQEPVIRRALAKIRRG